MKEQPFQYDMNQQADWASQRLEAKAREAAERERLVEQAKAEEDAAEAAIEKLGFWKRGSARARLRREARDRERAFYRPHTGSVLEFRPGFVRATQPPQEFVGLSGIQEVRVFGQPRPFSEVGAPAHYLWSETEIIQVNLTNLASIAPMECFIR